MPLRFRFRDIETEAEAFKKLAKYFIPVSEQGKLERFAAQLLTFKNSRMQSFQWQIPNADRVVTKLSSGGSDPDGNGTDVKGAFNCIWDIQKIPDQRDQFEVNDKASCSLAILDAEQNNIVSWNMDIAAKEGSPGCFFHSQMHECPIAVPRFPAIAVSPFASFEYLLSEIFHEEWAFRVQNANASPLWRKVQRERTQKVLTWALSTVNVSSTSAWMAFKTAVPPTGLFV